MGILSSKFSYQSSNNVEVEKRKLNIELPDVIYPDGLSFKEKTEHFMNALNVSALDVSALNVSALNPMSANKKLIRLNLWLAKELKKQGSKKDEPKSTVRSGQAFLKQ